MLVAVAAPVSAQRPLPPRSDCRLPQVEFQGRRTIGRGGHGKVEGPTHNGNVALVRASSAMPWITSTAGGTAVGQPLVMAFERMGYGSVLLDASGQVLLVNATAIPFLQ